MERFNDIVRVVSGIAVALSLLAAPAAHANLPLGACCLSQGICQDVMSTQCDGLSGSFIGEGTTCANTDCGRAAPVLSILALVGVAGALTGAGIFSVIRRRHR